MIKPYGANAKSAKKNTVSGQSVELLFCLGAGRGREVAVTSYILYTNDFEKPNTEL